MNVWLDVLFDATAETGTGASLIAKLIEFHGEPPRGSGYYPPDVVMIAAANAQRPRPNNYDVINGTVQAMLRKRPGAARALLVKNGYCGLNPLTGRSYTHEDRAWILGVTLDEFKNSLKAAYKSFGEIYQDLLEYESLKN